MEIVIRVLCINTRIMAFTTFKASLTYHKAFLSVLRQSKSFKILVKSGSKFCEISKMFHSHSQNNSLVFVVCLMLLHCTCSNPVQRQPKASVAFSNSHIDRREAAVKEFLMNSDSYIQLKNNDKKEMAYTYMHHEPYDYDLTCPHEVPTGPNDPPNKRSTCPWYYSVQHNPKQYPATIMKAERLCEYSVGSNNSLECVPVTQKMHVLELQNYRDESDNYVWTDRMVTVVTGYTSAGRRSFYSS